MAIQILSETPINVYQLKDELSRVKKRDKELNFRAQKTEEHISHVIMHKNGHDVFEKIKKMDIPRLRDQYIHKIVDLMPVTVKDLKVVLQAYNVSLSNESMKKIADTISEHIAKK